MNRSFSAAVALCLLAAALASAQDATPRVVVIGIDKKTQGELGPFGGSYRAIHPRLIEKLNASGVRAIAFDVYFPESPERADDTAKLAEAMKRSKAPVTIGFLAQDGQDGTLQSLPNAEVFDDARIGEGAVVARRELLIKRDEQGLYAETGALMIGAEALGRRSLIEETLTRAGVVDKEGFAALGLQQDVTVGWDGAEVKKSAFYPQLTRKPLTLSYADVLRKKPHPALRGAIVIVGMTDGEQDVHEHPDPNKPSLTKVSGVYLHAAFAQRALAAVAEKQRTEAARAPQQQASSPAVPQAQGSRKGISRVVQETTGE